MSDCPKCKRPMMIEPKNQMEHEAISSGMFGGESEVCDSCISDMESDVSYLRGEKKKLEVKVEKIEKENEQLKENLISSECCGNCSYYVFEKTGKQRCIEPERTEFREDAMISFGDRRYFVQYPPGHYGCLRWRK